MVFVSNIGWLQQSVAPVTISKYFKIEHNIKKNYHQEHEDGGLL